jgi:hypothetical protein
MNGLSLGQLIAAVVVLFGRFKSGPIGGPR